MAWLGVAPTGISISKTAYYEFKTESEDLSSPPVTYRRQQWNLVVEYRGMTQAAADTLMVPVIYTNGTKSCERSANGAGGYDVRLMYDYFSGDWSEGDDPYS